MSYVPANWHLVLSSQIDKLYRPTTSQSRRPNVPCLPSQFSCIPRRHGPTHLCTPTCPPPLLGLAYSHLNLFRSNSTSLSYLHFPSSPFHLLFYFLPPSP